MEIYLILLFFIVFWIWLNKKFAEIASGIKTMKKEIEKIADERANPVPDSVPAASREIPVEKEVEIPRTVVVPDAGGDVALPVPDESGEISVVMPPPLPVPDNSSPIRPITRKKINYEKYIGENLFGKIGILILITGVGLFVKYAIDNDWIDETLRTVLGFVSGSVLLVVAERLRLKYRTFSSLLAGGAFGIFYVTVAVAYHYYRLFSQPVAFAILVTVTILMSVLSVLYDRRELAIIALAGGFIAPFLVSTGDGNYKVLFSYLLILNSGMFALSLYKKWAELPVVSFGCSYLILFIYTWFAGPLFTEAGGLLVFTTLFYLLFLLPLLSILKNDSLRMNRLLLFIIIANNFIYLAFGLYFLSFIRLPFKADGLLSLFVALVNLFLVWRLHKKQKDRYHIIHALLGLVLTFVSITVPLQLSGNYITLFWASELVLLLWLYAKSGIRLCGYFSLALTALVIVSLGMDIHNAWHGTAGRTIFLNGTFLTQFYTGVCFLAAAFLIGRHRTFFDTSRILRYHPWNAIMLLLSVVTLYFAVMNDIYLYTSGEVCGKWMVLFSTATICLLTGVLQKRFPMERYKKLYRTGMSVVVLLTLADSYLNPGYDRSGLWYALSWGITLTAAGTLFLGGRYYYRLYACNRPGSKGFTVRIALLATLVWIAAENQLLHQWGLSDELNAGFSIALTLAALIQMALGMRLHIRVLRFTSLGIFAVVLVKLVAVDLWSMATIGKIVVFIVLGIILLVLSFLYQKLKNVLFRNDREEIE